MQLLSKSLQHIASRIHLLHLAGLVGLSLAYALPITDRLNGILTVSAETEQEMVAVERLAEYTRLQPQPLVLPALGQTTGAKLGIVNQKHCVMSQISTFTNRTVCLSVN